MKKIELFGAAFLNGKLRTYEGVLLPHEIEEIKNATELSTFGLKFTLIVGGDVNNNLSIYQVKDHFISHKL